MKKFLAIVLAAGLFVPVVVAQDKKASPDEQFKKLDKDGDGKLSLTEYKGKREGDKATKAEATFKKLDKNNDGFVSLEEFKGGAKKAK